MRFFTSSSRQLAGVLLVAALGLSLSTCALGLDWDSLSNECVSPNFDIPSFDRYCSGRLTQLNTFMPSGVAAVGERVDFLRVAVVGQLLAATALKQRVDESDSGCRVYTPIVSLAWIDDAGELQDLGSMVGDDYGLEFRRAAENQECAQADVAALWSTEVEIISTEPIQVLAAFGDGGLVSVIFTGDGRVASMHQYSGNGRASTQRQCVAGACVTAVDEYCSGHTDCANDTYCNASSRCQVLASCSLDRDCTVEGQSCARRRQTCTLTCESHSDCPHPFSCIAGLCGGEGCNADLPCVDGDQCRFEQCQPFCSLVGACDEELACFVDGDAGENYCGPGGTAGICSDDGDCYLGAVTGFAVLPENPITQGAGGLAVATFDRGLRWAGWAPGYHPYFLPADETSAGFEIFDVIWIEEYAALYATLPDLGMVRFDLGQALSDGEFNEEAHLHVRPLSLNPAAPLTEVDRVGDYLVTVEGGIAIADSPQPANTQSRVLTLNPDPTKDLDELDDVDLGRTIQPTAASVASYSDQLWIWGVDRTAGGELLVYDVRDFDNIVRLASSSVIQLTGSEERHWVQATPSGGYVGSSLGITPFRLEITGAFE